MAIALVCTVSLLQGAPALAEDGKTLSGGTNARSFTPTRGTGFNSPLGNKQLINMRVAANIKHAPRGSQIRIANYNIQSHYLVDLLIAAHKRGVHVAVVLDDNLINPESRRLKRALGGNTKWRNFVKFCVGACRTGSSAVMHTKVVSFTTSGTAQRVFMVTSGNLTGGAGSDQWNDSYTIVGNRTLWETWVKVFNEMKLDRRATTRRISYVSSAATVSWQKQSVRNGKVLTEPESSSQQRGKVVVANNPARINPDNDPVLRRLRLVSCRAYSGYGVRGRTVLRIMMYAWYGERGEYLARRVAQLKSQGCDVKVLISVGGDKTIRILRNAGVPVRAVDWDWDVKPSTGDPDEDVWGPRQYMHYKTMMVNGTYDRHSTHSVWTGSENWSAVSMGGDEITLWLRSTAVYRKYRERFDGLYSGKASHKVFKQPGCRVENSPCGDAVRPSGI